MKQVRLGLIGAGNRGRGIFGQYALDMPHRAAFTAVVEPDEAKREEFARQHGIAAGRRFASLDELQSADLNDLDGVVIATLEDLRLEPIAYAMSKAWAILTEKPLCTNAEELIRLCDRAAAYDGILIVSHQMRYTPIYRTVKELIASGRYGEITCLQHAENLSYSHMAHSFVRGFFNHSRLTPMLLAKSCHDADLMTYLMERQIDSVASFGSLHYFRRENCPPGAPEFCLEGCPHSAGCPFDVLKLYFNDDTDPAYLRQMGVVKDKNHRRELLMHNRFGRCVFQCDNDVVDNQVLSLQYDNGVTAGFTMCGTNGIERRTMKISLTNGEIQYDGIDPTHIRAWSFEPNRSELIEVAVNGTHGGGDRAIMDNFCEAIASGRQDRLLTPIRNSLEGHLLVFAAEEARQTRQVVNLRTYETQLRQKLSE